MLISFIDFTNKIVFLSLKIVYVLANSVDPDEMLHYAAFQLGLYCMPKYAFMKDFCNLYIIIDSVHIT